MEFKSIDSLSITECCEHLKIRVTDLPDIVGQINTSNERQRLLLERLKTLLGEDKVCFQSCTTISAYENYLSVWPDGLWREPAKAAINRLMAEAAELECYEKNKDSISGCKSYLEQYPNGRFATEIRNLLNSKIRARRTRNILVAIVLIITGIILCWSNYHPASYLELTGNGSFDKIGGKTNISYQTDATQDNIKIGEMPKWIDIVNNGEGILTASVERNYGDLLNDNITVTVYSSFFGVQYAPITKEIKFSQESGLPSFLEVNATNISFDKWGNCESCNSFTVNTDGCELSVESDATWFTISKDIKDNVRTFSANVNITSEENNEGKKTGIITIRSGNLTKQVEISQESGLATFFKVEKTSLNMKEGGTEEGMCYTIKVETDGTSWSVQDAPDWLNAYADLTDKRLEITLGANSGKIKNGTISLVSNNGDICNINVSQDGDPTDFGSYTSSVEFGTSSDYKYVTINNNSNKSLSVNDYESWLSCTVINKNKIKISCSQNYDDPPRSGNVYVSCGDEQVSIKVKQDGWTICKRCGGDGEISCPKNGQMNLPYWSFQYDNGTHYYVEWPMAMGMAAHMKRYERCKTCGGSGHIECPDCDGEGKSYKSY